MNVYVSWIFLPAYAILLSSIPASATPKFGVSAHDTEKSAVSQIFPLLKERNLRHYRVDVALANDTDAYQIQRFRDMVDLARANSVTIQPIIQVPFTWGDRTDAGKYPKGDLAALYLQGYNRTYNFVINFRNDINDWEMGNELNLLATDSQGKPKWGAGWTAAEFDTPIMNEWAAVLKGMSDAIKKINATYHLHLRRTLNTTSTMFGFLDFMKGKGVEFEKISYHYYERMGVNPHHYWGGVKPEFDLFEQLAIYHKPVVFNEVNCAEIYQTGFENESGKALTEQCFKSLHSILEFITTQTSANIETVNLYELFDEPEKRIPERYFGLMSDIRTPKVSLYIATRFAGGLLTPAELEELARRKF